jgi:hypothetical protein
MDAELAREHARTTTTEAWPYPADREDVDSAWEISEFAYGDD